MRTRFALFNIVVVVLALVAIFPKLTLGDDKPLVIAFAGDAFTLDPHARNEKVSWNIQWHMYSQLVRFSPDLKILPDLAVSWKTLDDFTWEFKLRQGVKFHNGEPFNAEAAKFSVERARNWEKSQLRGQTPDYKELIAVDEYTLRMVTKRPEPEVLLQLTYISMVPPKYFSQNDPSFLATHPVGTGPYKFVEWVKDDHIELVRNDSWYGGKTDFEKVIFRPIPANPTRVAALVSREIDVCVDVSIPDIPRVEKNATTYISRSPSTRYIYLTFNVQSDKGGPAPEMTPGIPEGKPNPFKDVRVRKAIAHAIDVDEIIKYVMSGSAYPAAQPLTSYSPDFNPGIKRPAYDPELAKRLLKEAGYPNGFEANFDAPNDRYVNDQQIAEAIAGQLTKIGIKLKVVAQTKTVFFNKLEKSEFAMALLGMASPGWNTNMNLIYKERKGAYGNQNYGRFKDAALEKRIDEAVATVDPKKRIPLVRAIMADAVSTYYVIPLHYQESVVGFSKGVIGKPRLDETLYAFELKRAK
jgi:peptide/nickel transport system substrate-binding protein